MLFSVHSHVLKVTIYFAASNCSKPKAPPNVSLTCADWSKGISCSVRCNQPSIHNFVEQIPSFYKCGREGFWDPPRGKDFTFPICAGNMIFKILRGCPWQIQAVRGTCMPNFVFKHFSSFWHHTLSNELNITLEQNK